MMNTERICPGCHKTLPPDVPLGLCPECLIKAGFQTGTESGSAGSGFVPPPVEDIRKLFPQLEVIELIGKGGMGAVYKARQPALDRFVALKILRPSTANDSGFAERFNREARALARLNHPNIVAVHDFGRVDGLHYLVMEFVDGANLREVERAGRLLPEQALTIVPQICEALQFAHGEGIVHRDIKPENILMDKRGRVKITDFGIAKILGVTAGKSALTGAKDIVGTPHYMAPEQIEKPQTVDHRADIYSLGVVFYEMLTGELPLGKFAAPSAKVHVDVRLDEVVLRTLEKEPERRYQQASILKTDVETIATTGMKPAFAADTRTPRGRYWAAKKSIAFMIVCGCFLVSLVNSTIKVVSDGWSESAGMMLVLSPLALAGFASAAYRHGRYAWGSGAQPTRKGLLLPTLCLLAVLTVFWPLVLGEKLGLQVTATTLCAFAAAVAFARLLRKEKPAAGKGLSAADIWWKRIAWTLTALLGLVVLFVVVPNFIRRGGTNVTRIAASTIRDGVKRQLREVGATFDDIRVTVAESRDSSTPFAVNYRGLRNFNYTHGGQPDPNWPASASGQFIMNYIGGCQWQGKLGDTQFTVQVGQPDNIDLPFVADPEILGEWLGVDLVPLPSQFNPVKPRFRDAGRMFKGITFLENGEAQPRWWRWTKGVVIQTDDKTAGRYEIREIKGQTYMFLEWKNGEVMLAGRKPQYYVFRKVSATSPLAAAITADQVIVEDLALRMLAAIRDKENDVLKSLAVDRIKGWRDSLPGFAFEGRERFQQMRGRPFNMLPTESLIEQNYAVVKCDDPKESNAVYLVLYFVKTDDSWKNWMMRNSPPSKTLATFLAEKPPASETK